VRVRETKEFFPLLLLHIYLSATSNSEFSEWSNIVN
jgi:hypothetical protein